MYVLSEWLGLLDSKIVTLHYLIEKPIKIHVHVTFQGGHLLTGVSSTVLISSVGKVRDSNTITIYYCPDFFMLIICFR